MEYHNPTLRVLRILELIDANSGGLSLSEIANLLDLPKGTISPILKTLAVFFGAQMCILGIPDRYV